MDGPFGIPGKTRRGAESDCLLTLLIDTTAERVRFSYRMNDHDLDDFKQSTYLHVIVNWKYFKPENCAAGAALRTMVAQGAANSIAKVRPGGPVVICATDVAASCDETVNAMDWVPTVDITGDREWSPHDNHEVADEATQASEEVAVVIDESATSQTMLFD